MARHDGLQPRELEAELGEAAFGVVAAQALVEPRLSGSRIERLPWYSVPELAQ
jgi:hypothetical protein